MTNLDSVLKSRDITANKGPSSQSFSSCHVRMWELDHNESWEPKNWCFRTVVLEKPLESPLDSKEIQPVNPKGNHPWIFIGRTEAEDETPILWPPDAKSWLIWEDPDAGKNWRQEEKGTREDEMVGWHHWLNGQWWWICSMNLSKLQEIVKDRKGWCAAVHGVAKSQTWLCNWTELNWPDGTFSCCWTFTI